MQTKMKDLSLPARDDNTGHSCVTTEIVGWVEVQSADTHRSASSVSWRYDRSLASG